MSVYRQWWVSNLLIPWSFEPSLLVKTSLEDTSFYPRSEVCGLKISLRPFAQSNRDRHSQGKSLHQLPEANACSMHLPSLLSHNLQTAPRHCTTQEDNKADVAAEWTSRWNSIQIQTRSEALDQLRIERSPKKRQRRIFKSCPEVESTQHSFFVVIDTGPCRKQSKAKQSRRQFEKVKHLCHSGLCALSNRVFSLPASAFF